MSQAKSSFDSLGQAVHGTCMYMLYFLCLQNNILAQRQREDLLRSSTKDGSVFYPRVAPRECAATAVSYPGRFSLFLQLWTKSFSTAAIKSVCGI